VLGGGGLGGQRDSNNHQHASVFVFMMLWIFGREKADTVVRGGDAAIFVDRGLLLEGQVKQLPQ
jgi:hypothetical protein